MSISKGSTLQWSDIQTLYNNLNTARRKFDYRTVTVPSNPGKVLPSQVTSLKNSIEELRNSFYVGSTANTGITVPSSGTLVYPNIFTTMSNKISAINKLCAHDSFTEECEESSGGGDFFAENGNNTFHSSSGTANSFST